MNIPILGDFRVVQRIKYTRKYQLTPGTGSNQDEKDYIIIDLNSFPAEDCTTFNSFRYIQSEICIIYVCLLIHICLLVATKKKSV